MIWAIVPLLSVFVLMAGCGGGNDTAPTIENPNCPDGALDASWGCIQDFVFTPTCARSGCHSEASAAQGLRLDAANSPGIVGRPSTEKPGLNLIESGDPDISYLILKIEGDPSISLSRMPLGGPFLDNPTIQTMRDWVTAGASVP